MDVLSSEERFKNIEYNIGYIRQRIADAAVKSGRNPDEVRLMAVTKTVEPMFINHAIECGIDLIGENKVQEFLSKKPYLKLDGVEAHLIGHLQTNKVRQIISEVSMIQSVDSLKLAREISKRSEALGITAECLLEINIGDEESKTGLNVDNVYEVLSGISALPSIKIKGLMAIPPFSANDYETEKYFSQMREFFIDIKAQKIDNVSMDILSMGMSGDYESAVRNGSTLVRVGSALFGPRLY